MTFAYVFVDTAIGWSHGVFHFWFPVDNERGPCECWLCQQIKNEYNSFAPLIARLIISLSLAKRFLAEWITQLVCREPYKVLWIGLANWLKGYNLLKNLLPAIGLKHQIPDPAMFCFIFLSASGSPVWKQWKYVSKRISGGWLFTVLFINFIFSYWSTCGFLATTPSIWYVYSVRILNKDNWIQRNCKINLASNCNKNIMVITLYQMPTCKTSHLFVGYILFRHMNCFE